MSITVLLSNFSAVCVATACEAEWLFTTSMQFEIAKSIMHIQFFLQPIIKFISQTHHALGLYAQEATVFWNFYVRPISKRRFSSVQLCLHPNWNKSCNCWHITCFCLLLTFMAHVSHHLEVPALWSQNLFWQIFGLEILSILGHYPPDIKMDVTFPTLPLQAI